MDRIRETVKGRLAEAKLTSLDDEIRKSVLREFARNGKSLTSGEIAGRLRISVETVDQAIEKLQKADILSSRGNKITSAYPFSADKTRHKVIFEDEHEVYALCATDALGVHFMLNENLIILSRCPECENEIKIAVKDGLIDFRNPDGIIEFVSNRERCGSIAETLCPFINFFCSNKHLEKWREKNPEYRDGEVYSLDDALEHGRIIFGDFLK